MMEKYNKKKAVRIEQREKVSQGQMVREIDLMSRVKKLISATKWERGSKKEKSSRQLAEIKYFKT